MPEAGINTRRRFLRNAAVAIAAAELVPVHPADGQSNKEARELPRIKPSTNTSFGALKQIDAGLLNVGYAEAGPANGSPVILLPGWPYDIHSYVDVTPLLASARYRVIVPYLRGYSETRRSLHPMVRLASFPTRNGQQSAVALDVIALMDALGIEKAIVGGGFDWGSRTAVIMAALWPEHCKAIVAVSGYLITKANQQPLPPQAELGWWYQYYFATERGKLGYSQHRYEFNKLIWKTLRRSGILTMAPSAAPRPRSITRITSVS